MSDSPTPTLYELFFRSAEALENSGAGRATAGWLRERGIPLWEGMREDIDKDYRKILQPSVGRLIGGAWNGYHELQKLKQATLKDPDLTEHFRGGKQTIDVTLKPEFQLTINDQETGPRVTIEVRVALVLQAIHLTIRRGRIEAIAPGRCTASGQLEVLSAKVPLVEEVVDLPGRIEFDEGIPL